MVGRNTLIYIYGRDIYFFPPEWNLFPWITQAIEELKEQQDTSNNRFVWITWFHILTYRGETSQANHILE
jgi:hypothetical protein